MVVVTVKKKSYKITKNIKDGLDKIQKKIISNNDLFVCIVDGRSGTGKSTLASQLAYYCTNGRLSYNDYIYTYEQFNNWIDSCQPGDHMILDESFEIANKRNSRSEDNFKILSKLQKIRAKKVAVWLLLPSFYDLDKNIILNLADWLLHCWRKDFGPRGNFNAYKRNRFKLLWLKGRQNLSYEEKIIRPNLSKCSFSKLFPLDYQTYELRKYESFEENIIKSKKELRLEKNMRLWRERAVLSIKYAQKNGIKYTDIANHLGITTTLLYNWTKQSKQEEWLDDGKSAQNGT